MPLPTNALTAVQLEQVFYVVIVEIVEGLTQRKRRRMSFEIECAGEDCHTTLKLLKDSTEGQKVFCGWCFSDRVAKRLEEKEEKKNEDTKK